MTAGKHNFAIEQEDTFLRVLTWTEADLVTPIDLSGCTAKMTINYVDSGVPGSFSISTTWSANGFITINGPAGEVTLLIPATTTENFTWRNGAYDLHLKFPDETVFRLVEGGTVVNRTQTDII